MSFPKEDAGKTVTINAAPLYNRCHNNPHLEWLGPTGEILSGSARSVDQVRLDENGNAFVVALGLSSCAAGNSLIEAILEETPYTAYTSEFTVEPPPTGGGGPDEPHCEIHSLPSFADQGSDPSHVADYIEVRCEEVFAEQHVEIKLQSLDLRCHDTLHWASRTPSSGSGATTESSSSITLELDNDGNAAAVLWGGPGCDPGKASSPPPS